MPAKKLSLDTTRSPWRDWGRKPFIASIAQDGKQVVTMTNPGGPTIEHYEIDGSRKHFSDATVDPARTFWHTAPVAIEVEFDLNRDVAKVFTYGPAEIRFDGDDIVVMTENIDVRV